MKILFIINNLLTLYNFRQELIDLLLQQGFNIYIATPESPYESVFSDKGCTIMHYDLSQHGMNPFKDFALPGVYSRLIKNVSPDVVLLYTIKPNIYGGMACAALNRRHCATITGLGSAFEKGWLTAAISLALYRIGLRKVDRLFFQNEANQKFFQKNGIALGRHKLVSGSGVNLTKHRFESYPDNKIIKFLFIGRVCRDKGIYELIEAFKRIKANHANVSLELLGNVEAECETLISRATEEGILISHGRHENVHDYIKEAHAIVLPSYHEGMANVLLEAAASGRPIIATDIPGCKEAVDDGVTGFLCRPADTESLYLAIEKFLLLSRERQATMGVKGREKMQREFDRDAVNLQYLQFIRIS